LWKDIRGRGNGKPYGAIILETDINKMTTIGISQNVVLVMWLEDLRQDYVTVEKIQSHLKKASPTTLALVEAAISIRNGSFGWYNKVKFPALKILA